MVARRGHEQYLADLASAGERRTVAGGEAARLRAAEQSVRALEQVAHAARAAEEARATAERARAALMVGDNAARRSWVTAPRPDVPRQNCGRAVAPVVDTAGADPALLDTVAAARTAWHAAPQPSVLDGPSAEDLRGELAALPADGVDPEVRSLADAHRTALADADARLHGLRRDPCRTPRAPPGGRRPRCAARAGGGPGRCRPEPVALRSAVRDGPDAAPGGGRGGRDRRREAAAAEERYEQLRATAPAAGARSSRR